MLGDKENILILLFKWIWNFLQQRCFVFFGHSFSLWDIFVTVILLSIAGYVIRNALDDD